MKKINYRIVEKTGVDGSICYLAQYKEIDFSDKYSIYNDEWLQLPFSKEYVGDEGNGSLKRCQQEIGIDKAKREYEHKKLKNAEKVIEETVLILE